MYKIGDEINIKEDHPAILQGLLDDLELADEMMTVAAGKRKQAKESFWASINELHDGIEKMNWRLNPGTGIIVAVNSVEYVESYRKMNRHES